LRNQSDAQMQHLFNYLWQRYYLSSTGSCAGPSYWHFAASIAWPTHGPFGPFHSLYTITVSCQHLCYFWALINVSWKNSVIIPQSKDVDVVDRMHLFMRCFVTLAANTQVLLLKTRAKGYEKQAVAARWTATAWLITIRLWRHCSGPRCCKACAINSNAQALRYCSQPAGWCRPTCTHFWKMSLFSKRWPLYT